MNLSMLIDGMPGERIAALDRGLAYGDGLFETLRVVDGRAPLWQRHMQRLADGCARLRLSLPDAETLARETARVCAGRDLALVRITVTRGAGARGYAPPAGVAPTRMVAAFSYVPLPPEYYQAGVRLRWCQLRLATQPALAGIKHLNRLEQVLARAEWDDPAIFEGVLCDSAGRVISASAANLFCVIDGRVVTPLLSRCGVAGVARATVLENFGTTEIRDLLPEELMQASEIFLCNSVRGILPVRQLGERRFAAPGALTRELQARWLSQGWMDADEVAA